MTASKAIHDIIDSYPIDAQVAMKMKECADLFMSGRVIKSDRREGLVRLMVLCILHVNQCLDVPLVCHVMGVTFQQIKKVLGHPSTERVLKHLGINAMTEAQYVRGTILMTCRYVGVDEQHLDSINDCWHLLHSLDATEITSSMYVTIVALVARFTTNSKKIAEAMCLSASTVTAARKKIDKILE